MKKILFLIGAIVLSFSAFTEATAQQYAPCVEPIRQFFRAESTTGTPKVLNVLGTNPQFGRVPLHTAKSAYDHLKNKAKKSKVMKAEADRILIALGYTGLNDPAFDVSDISPEVVPSGTMGWMGAGGNKYVWSSFGKEFNGFKIMSKNSPCFVYLMRDCGNLFWIPPTCPDCEARGTVSAFSNAFCDYTNCDDCANATSQTISVVGNGNIATGDCIMGEKEIELVATYGGEAVCLGKRTVPVNVSYAYEASGSTSASETVMVEPKNALETSELKIPVNLAMSIDESSTSVGKGGKVYMEVTAKRFKALKALYPTCAMEESAEMAKALVAPVTDEASVEMAQSVVDGKSGLKKQTLFFSGSDVVSDVVTKEHNSNLTVIAHSTKTGKLVKGESADRYLCLGQYGVPGSSSMLYSLTGNSNLTQTVEVCDSEGNEPAEKNIDLPMNLDASFTSQEMKVGNDGRVYIEVSEKEYKKLAKRFSRCCSNGDSSCN